MSTGISNMWSRERLREIRRLLSSTHEMLDVLHHPELGVSLEAAETQQKLMKLMVALEARERVMRKELVLRA